MIGACVFTPAIWPPLLGAVFLVAIGLHSWKRRDVPVARLLAVGALVSVLWLLSIVLEVAVVTPATKIAWYKFRFAMQLSAVITGTRFTLEYAYPRRWLTRRNPILLSTPLLLTCCVIITNQCHLVWFYRLSAVGYPGPATQGGRANEPQDRRCQGVPYEPRLTAAERDTLYWKVALGYIFLGTCVRLRGRPSSNSLTASAPVTRVDLASGAADLQRDLGGLKLGD